MPPGRPSTLTAEIAERICAAMRASASLTLAADKVGVPTKTALGWRSSGEQARACEVIECGDPHHGPSEGLTYHEFAEQVQLAKGYAGMRAVASVSSRFPSDPRFAERWLAKHYAADYGPQAGLHPEVDPAVERSPYVVTFIEQNRPKAEMDEIAGLLASPDGLAASGPAATDADDPHSTSPGAQAPEPPDR